MNAVAGGKGGGEVRSRLKLDGHSAAVELTEVEPGEDLVPGHLAELAAARLLITAMAS
jgi:hypothetical protein